MTIYRGTLSSSATGGTYAVNNDLLGQLKTLILNSSNAAVTYDNDPGPTTLRVIQLQFGTSQHWMQLTASPTDGTFYCSIKNLAGTLDANAGRTFSSANNASVIVLTGPNMFIFAINGAYSPFWAKGVDTKWYSVSSTVNDAAYGDVSDTALHTPAAQYPTLTDSSGNNLFSSVAVSLGTVLYTYLKALWETTSPGGAGVFVDQNGVNYMNLFTGSYVWYVSDD